MVSIAKLASGVGNVVKTLAEIDAYEVEAISAVRIRGTRSIYVSGTAWKDGRKFMLSGTVDPEQFSYDRDIAITDLATDNPFEGLA